MDLTVDDVVELLDVTPQTLAEWLKEGKIPSYKLQDEYRFSRIEVEDWMIEQQPLSGPSSGTGHFCLYRALHRGDLLFGVEGKSKQELIHSASKQIAPLLDLDQEMLFELLWDREQKMSTALGKGIALPHTRELIQKMPADRVFVVYLEETLEYGALDHESVHTLFFPFASQDKAHLRLLAKFSHLITDPAALAFLKTRPSKDKLLEFIFDWEDRQCLCK